MANRQIVLSLLADELILINSKIPEHQNYLLKGAWEQLETLGKKLGFRYMNLADAADDLMKFYSDSLSTEDVITLKQIVKAMRNALLYDLLPST